MKFSIAFSAKKPIERAKVTFDYEPENPDELKLTVGDILIVINKEEEGWWEGELKGKTGMFPSNFVEVLPSAEELPAPVVRIQKLGDTLKILVEPILKIFLNEKVTPNSLLFGLHL